MKTLQEVKREHDEIISSADLNAVDKINNPKRKRCAFLKTCILYLEHNPNESFVRQMLEEKKASLENINNSYPQWRPPNPDIKNLRAAFESEMGTKKIKNQISALKFILSK